MLQEVKHKSIKESYSMACHYPNQAWRSESLNSKGKRVPVFKEEHGVGDPFLLPCGKCMGCRQEYMRSWGIRCYHEAKMWPQNCFVTLTYDPKYIPPHGVLHYPDFKGFLDRLRKRKQYLDTGVRYFGCGEYGGKHQRPHFHAILFGVDFIDREHMFNKNGNPVYTSEILRKCWGQGNVSVQDACFETARYVAGYAAKKWGSHETNFVHSACDIETREEFIYPPENTKKSWNIGKSWLEKYWRDVFPGNGRAELIINGRPQKPPKAYVDWLRDTHPLEFEKLKEKRDCKIDASQFVLKRNMQKAREKHELYGSKLKEFNEDDFMSRRLHAEEKCLLAKVNNYVNERK